MIYYVYLQKILFHLFTYLGCAPTGVLAVRDKNTDIQWRGNPQMGAHFSAVFAKSPYRVEQLHERRGRVLCAVGIECVGVMLWVMYYREEWSIFVGTMSIYCQTNRKHRMGVRVAITRARMRVLVQLEHIFSAFVHLFVGSLDALINLLGGWAKIEHVAKRGRRKVNSSPDLLVLFANIMSMVNE